MTNDYRRNILISDKKKKIAEHLKEKGFYYSKKAGRYIDDKYSGILGGSGTDYIIEIIDVL